MKSTALAISGALLALSAAERAEPELAVEIRCDCAELRAGDEIPITFTITNTGEAPYPYTHRTYDRSGRMPEYQVGAVMTDGKPVVDPRSLSQRGFIGGGLGSSRELAPGGRFMQTIALNLWALVKDAGTYVVRGRFVPSTGPTVEAPPIAITVLPRSPDEMRQYIRTLGAELNASMPVPPPRLIQRLMYTGEPQAADVLRPIVSSDNNTRFWIEYAFAYYLKKD